MKYKALGKIIAIGLMVLPTILFAGLIHNETKVWPISKDGITRISVCWMQLGFDTERNVILNAIRGTWQRVAKINFIDKGDCASITTPKISVSIIRSSAGSNAQAIGTGLNTSVSFSVPVELEFDRLRYLAVHEFGHALGFQHEQDSPLRNNQCSTSDAWGNVSQLGSQAAWDPDSIMNSGCNIYANSIGYLSPGDVDSIRILYGRRKILTHGDFDGGGATDWATWNATTGWKFDILANPGPKRWGELGDKIVPGDYDGNGRTDRAIWRPRTGEWWIDIPGFSARIWGVNGDVPVPADYNGDGLTDRAIFRPNSRGWWVDVPGEAHDFRFGSPGDIPVPADYDGDGRANIAVWSPSTGTWQINSSIKPPNELQFVLGHAGYIPIPGDYVGEGQDRAAVFNPVDGCFKFSVRPLYALGSPGSTEGTLCFANHQPGDIPAKGRFTNQLHEEPVLFRPSTGTYFTRTGASRTTGPNNSIPAY